MTAPTYLSSIDRIQNRSYVLLEKDILFSARRWLFWFYFSGKCLDALRSLFLLIRTFTLVARHVTSTESNHLYFPRVRKVRRKEISSCSDRISSIRTDTFWNRMPCRCFRNKIQSVRFYDIKGKSLSIITRANIFLSLFK